MSWDVYIYVFFLAHVKFLFAASIAEATTDLNFLEILFSSTLGALFCYNVSFLLGRFIFFKNNSFKDIVIFKKRKKKFKKRNRIIIRIKNSKLGYLILCSLAPVFLTIPIGTFIVLKFYGHRKWTYWFVFTSIASISFILTFINHFIFN
ncbi:hypothetical protein OAD79_01585 [Flavobacteriales bacterium]|jgi:membrane protein DedA with SNARE-associated domain|nr:hypothetical protein [Flavobacteriales bacterium]